MAVFVACSPAQWASPCPARLTSPLGCAPPQVNENNIRTLTGELLAYLNVCDLEFKGDLTTKICMLVQRFAPDKRWYIDIMVQVGAGRGCGGREVGGWACSTASAPDGTSASSARPPCSAAM